jgi:polyisoprenoid-binding protein YceI
MLTGRFNTFDGSFFWDENDPSSASVEITIDMTSSDSNHSLRDEHLQGPNYMNAAEHPTATFSSTSYEGDSQGGTLNGDLTMNGVTQSISLPINKIGQGSGMQMGMTIYKAGFEGNMIINPQDFNFERPGTPVEIEINFEGNRR